MKDNKDRDEVLAAVKEGSYALKNVDESFKKDREIVMIAVKIYGNALEYADESLKKDKEIVLAAVKQIGFALEYADESLKKNKEIVLAAVKQRGTALQYADELLQKDKEIVMAAVKQDGLALEYADESLKKDKEIVDAAINQDGNALEFADEIFRKSKEIGMPIYNYEIEISGNGAFQIVEEVSKATYEYFDENDELLENHIFDEEEVPDEHSIGYWDSLCESADFSQGQTGMLLGECSISVTNTESDDESYSFYLDEKELKDQGLKLTREKQIKFDELVAPGEVKYFFIGNEEHEGSWVYELKTKSPFEVKKLDITVCKVESTDTVTSFWYDLAENEDFDLSDGSSDYSRTLKVIKIDKQDIAESVDSNSRYFEFKDAHSSKFWEISVSGATITVLYGKLGTNGQTSVKELDSPEEAQEHATKQANGKIKKGYQEIQKIAEG